MKTTPLALRARVAQGARLFLGTTFGAMLLSSSLARAQAPAATANWTGSIRCEINVTADGYSHQETQTWTLTGAVPTQQGSMTIYPATWSVTGQGWHDRSRGSNRVVSKWIAKVPGQNNAPVRAPVAFMLNANGQMFLQLWHAQLTSGGGYTGTDHYFSDGVSQPERRLAQTVYEYQFPKIEAAPTDTQITGTDTREVKMGVGPWHPGDAQVMVTLTWALGRGSAPPMPAPTLPPPPPQPAVAGAAPAGGPSPTGSSAPPSGTTIPTTTIPPAQSTPPVSSTPSSTPTSVPPTSVPPTSSVPANLAKPTIVSISPSTIRQGYGGGGTFLLKGRGTHWVRGVTTVDFGPGVTLVSPMYVVDAETATTFPKIEPDATPGPRTITVTTGEEVVTLVNGFTITATPVDVAPVRPSERQVAPEPTAPADPGHFTARQVGEGEVELRWDAAPGVERYVLHSTQVAGRTNPEINVTGTTQRINLLKPGEYEWQVSSWYAPDGARTAPADWPRAKVTVKAPGWYRVTAAHVKIHREEPDNRVKVHGKNNEIFFSKHAQVIDRGTGAKMSYDPGPTSTQVHGDTNNADPVFKSLPYETRIPAGSVSSDGGIQTGDDIKVWTGQSKNLYPRNGVYSPSECAPFVLWEGKLIDGIEVVLVRPVVWLAIDRRDRGNEQFWDPYRNRMGAENSTDALNVPEIRANLGSDEVSVITVPQWSTTGQWRVDQHRPFGLAVSGNSNGAPAVWTDRVLVLTKEKIDAFLATNPTGQFEMPRVRGTMGGGNAIPMGEYSLFLKIEQLQ